MATRTLEVVFVGDAKPLQNAFGQLEDNVMPVLRTVAD